MLRSNISRRTVNDKLPEHRSLIAERRSEHTVNWAVNSPELIGVRLSIKFVFLKQNQKINLVSKFNLIG